MDNALPWRDLDPELAELRRTDQVLVSLQQMLSCKRRGLCLMHEWFRRYGTSGTGCHCFARFEEHVVVYDAPDDVGGFVGPQL